MLSRQAIPGVLRSAPRSAEVATSKNNKFVLSYQFYRRTPERYSSENLSLKYHAFVHRERDGTFGQ